MQTVTLRSTRTSESRNKKVINVFLSGSEENLSEKLEKIRQETENKEWVAFRHVK